MDNKKKFAFGLFEYVRFGGMQRDLMRIARACMDRGHSVHIYARIWEGALPENIQVTLIKGYGFSNHRRCESFAKRLMKHIEPGQYDAVVGFNRMPGLDVYFMADTSFAARAVDKGFLYRLSGRSRTYMRLEKAVFDKDSKTIIMLISEKEKSFLKYFYGTDESRFHFLPPGISRDRLAPANARELGTGLKNELSIPDSNNIALMIGSGFNTKGVDRAIEAVASLPAHLRDKTTLIVAGEGNPKKYIGLARKHGIAANVIFTGGRNDIPRFLAAADILLHPARRENTGTVLIEAMASGLPVLVTEVCGYSFHIKKADAGLVVPSPFKQKTLDKMLQSMLVSEKKMQWKKNGLDYISKTDVFHLPEKAADIIEMVASC